MRKGINLNEPGLAELAESESNTVKKQIAEGLELARVVKWARAYVKKYPDQFKGLKAEEAVAEALKRYYLCSVNLDSMDEDENSVKG
jgi:hypothetical protein